MKILFIGAININTLPTGGEEYKNQLLFQKLTECHNMVLIDTYKWRKKPLVWINLYYNIFFVKFDSIIISASSVSTYNLLRIIGFINPSKLLKINYFVIGGYFPVGIATNRFNWRIYNKLKSIILEGNLLKKLLIENSELNNVFVIPNFKKFEKVENRRIYKETFRFIYVGRISRQKGILEIFDSVQWIKEYQPDLDFMVDFFGTNEDRINFPPNLPIKYQGYLNLMHDTKLSYELLSQYDCMLFPTYWPGEGFPGVIIDAFVAGLPVIATNWNMNSELIEENITGLLIPIANSQELANAMVKLLSNRNLLNSMSDNSFKLSKNYHIDTIWPQVEKIIFN